MTTLIVTVIICVPEADQPNDDSVTTYGCSWVRSDSQLAPPLPPPNDAVL